ncbi:MAG: YhcH/YjgK/YiaL family protein [Clostridiales bacterium]|nr:YhcH/YjgK/YiaL family protein [Clostridiales bacterium]
MIYAKLTDAPYYWGIHPRLDLVLKLLNPKYLATIGTEKQCLDGENLFVTCFDVTTSRDESRFFEYHQRYLDVFVTVHGRERVDIADPGKLELREQRGDYWGAEGEAEQSVFLAPDRFLVLFPGDAHRPGMAVGREEDISRIVFKILL